MTWGDAMPTRATEVKAGAYFKKGPQLRKVIKRTRDKRGRVRVHWVGKSVRIKNSRFGYGHTIANPPLLSTFISQCDRLSGAEVAHLRKAGIILRGE